MFIEFKREFDQPNGMNVVPSGYQDSAWSFVPAAMIASSLRWEKCLSVGTYTYWYRILIDRSPILLLMPFPSPSCPESPDADAYASLVES